MQSLRSIFLIFISILFLISCNVGYKKTASDIEYRYIKKGSGEVAKDGDFIKAHMIRYMGDSMVQDSHKGDAEMIPYKKDLGKGQKYNLSDILAIVKKGDSILVRVPMDSIFKDAAQRPPFFKKGAYIKIILSVLDIVTPEQFKKEAETKRQQILEGLKISAQKDKPAIDEFVAKNSLKGTFTDLGVFVNTIKEGTGAVVKKDSSVSIRYIGKLLNGTIFDANTGSKEFANRPPLNFIAGQGQLIPGFDYSLIDLKKGSKVRLLIPSALAYGERAAGDKIPANSILDFYIEILN